LRATKGISAAAIVAALAVALGATGASASVSSGTAMTAKKRCKHGKAKKRCHRSKRRSDALHSPVIRATLSWSNGGASDVDMDLHVFDANGDQAGNGSNTIPLTSLSPDVSGPAGSETFTDSLFTRQAARDLSFGVCYLVGGSVHTDFTLTYVTADGLVHGDSQSPGSSTHFDYPGGAPIPVGYCPH
jgi:hypothetical protein